MKPLTTNTPHNTLPARLALKARLPRTWPAFFERHGTFTNAQLATIPRLLDGHNVMLCAPTASGKTEAAVAPLIERHLPPTRPPATLRILYLTPTRALVNDLYARLSHPLETLQVSPGVRTYDLSTFRPDRPPDLLITTPESVDSLLANHAKLFANLRAIVIDELHIFDGTPRGNQLRALLNRLRHIRHYASTSGDAPDALLHYVALSATLPAPAAAAARYFDAAEVVEIGGQRAMTVEHLALAPDSSAELLEYIGTFRAQGWRKALVFCNSRAEVEAYATAVRSRSPFGNAVYVHYSNIEAERRHEIESQFAQAEAAICFASTTLELGIDIGSVDVVILIGPPGSSGSFVQRVGRGNRRRGTTHVCCCARTRLERALFDALVAPPDDPHRPTPAPFRPSVAVQQIFSLLRQSPTGAVRLNEVARLFEGLLSRADIESILGYLEERRYVQPGRPGEWRPGPRLNDLLDQQSSGQADMSIHTNIRGSSTRTVAIRSQHTQRELARVEAHWLNRDTLTIEGRPVNVAWHDGEALWVSPAKESDPTARQWYRSSRQVVSYALARRLPMQLGLPPGAAPFVPAPDGWWWFHWLGDSYGRAALDVLRYHWPVRETPHPALCLHMAGDPHMPPLWEEAQVIRYLEESYRAWEPLLDLGPFHHMLPTALRRRAVVEQFDVPGFLDAMAALRPLSALEALSDDVLALVEEA